MQQSLDEFKMKSLKKALRQTRGNRTLAAKKLEVSVRTVRNWIAKYELDHLYPPQHGRKK